MTDQPLILWCSQEGRALARKILGDNPYVPHDYQIDGVVHTLDREHLVAVTPTGSGKSGYHAMPIRILLAIANDPYIISPYSYHVPKHPKALLIYPTNALEEQQAKNLNEFGIPAIAINSDILHTEHIAGHDLWKHARSDEVVALCLSPEQLVSKEFEQLLNDKDFVNSICLWGVDEIHFIESWGSMFRKAFLEIGHIHSRLGTSPPLVATTATLPSGEPMDFVLRFLNLRRGGFYFLHRSNARYDIQYIFRELQHSLTVYNFPQLYWVLESNRKTLIFCQTISLSFRLFAYFWHCPISATRDRNLFVCTIL
ncbi:P-loop containing nucleoside triphosphate hydrolase protein [Fistulina hepatica ATCC 64428]|uniref:DNA 3'-5' helicase n=1 Tax=Fistulina hepatica ATCC 64428 TaxID=1128425 RepID=A0A0D7A0E1_9AGAR|nr:P-loop containing nucleoside triphosphate hydrolase protein [Fistulina hepatica ATCC 64428]